MHALLHLIFYVVSLGVIGILAILNVVLMGMLITKHRPMAIKFAKKTWPFVKYFSLPENSREDILRSSRSRHFQA